MALSKMASQGDPCYFKLPSFFVMLLIAFGMTLTAMCVYAPGAIPYHYLGLIGDLARFLAYQRPKLIAGIWYGAVAIHVSEAIYAFHLAGKKCITGCARVKWFVSTLFFGIGSLAILLRYHPDGLGQFLTEFDDEVEDDSPDDSEKDPSKKVRIVALVDLDDSEVKELTH